MSFCRKIPDETRPFARNGHVDLYFTPDGTVGVSRFHKNWSWENDVAPLAGTKTCQMIHTGICQQGSMKVTLDSGKTLDIQKDDVFHIEKGHTAYVTSEEDCVMVDFSGASNYAQRHS